MKALDAAKFNGRHLILDATLAAHVKDGLAELVRITATGEIKNIDVDANPSLLELP